MSRSDNASWLTVYGCSSAAYSGGPIGLRCTILRRVILRAVPVAKRAPHRTQTRANDRTNGAVTLVDLIAERSADNTAQNAADDLGRIVPALTLLICRGIGRIILRKCRRADQHRRRVCAHGENGLRFCEDRLSGKCLDHVALLYHCDKECLQHAARTEAERHVQT